MPQNMLYGIRAPKGSPLVIWEIGAGATSLVVEMCKGK